MHYSRLADNNNAIPTTVTKVWRYKIVLIDWLIAVVKVVPMHTTDALPVVVIVVTTTQTTNTLCQVAMTLVARTTRAV